MTKKLLLLLACICAGFAFAAPASAHGRFCGPNTVHRCVPHPCGHKNAVAYRACPAPTPVVPDVDHALMCPLPFDGNVEPTAVPVDEILATSPKPGQRSLLDNWAPATYVQWEHAFKCVPGDGVLFTDASLSLYTDGPNTSYANGVTP